jgi:hypothetical protein
MFKKNHSTKLASFFVSISIICGIITTQIGQVFAASLSSLSDTQTSIKVNVVSDHTIQFVTPTGVAAGLGITINFPVGWNLGSVNASSTDFATSTSSTCSGFTDAFIANGAASGLTWGVSTTSQSITITSGSAVIPANRCVQIRFGTNAISQASGTAQITNPSSATSSALLINGTFGDNGIITTNIITNDTVAVTATVAQSFTFSISTSTIYFGTLSSSNAKFASSTNPLGDTLETIAHTLVASTNAPSGYTITVKGQTLTSLQSATNTINAIGASPASSTLTGTEQFGLRATVSGGTGATVSSPYSFATSYGYSATATTSAILATETSAANTTTYSLRYLANIAPLTEAGTYVANIVYVATANF